MPLPPPPPPAPDEWFDVVDADDRVVGRATRREVHAHGLLHRAVHILVHDGTGRWLLQRRAQTKDRYPGRWTAPVSGHVDAGETYPEAAVREMREEIGWADAAGLTHLGTVAAGPETEQEFIAVYRLLAPGPFAPDPAEVEALCWLGRAEVTARMFREPDAFTPSFIHIWSLWSPHLPGPAQPAEAREVT